MQSALANAKNQLVRRWGEMGGYWGINRTMAEIHGLLFVTREPLCTDDIMEQLQISRGNASMNLRALVDWGLIQRVHKLGDRKEYFQADTDVWHMFETIMRERRRREVEPIIDTIDKCMEVIQSPDGRVDGEDAREFRRRMESLRKFLETMGNLFELVLQFGEHSLNAMAQAGAAAPASASAAPTRVGRSRGDAARNGRG